MLLQRFNRRAFILGTLAASALPTAAMAKNKGPKAKPTKKKSSTEADIVVIGAGMAGISAARTLKAYGWDVIVVEARPRLGGRIWTSDALGAPLDLGAAWIHGKKNNPLAKVARELGVKTHETSWDSVTVFDGSGRKFAAKDVEASYEKLEALVDKAFKSGKANKDKDQALRAAIAAAAGGAPVKPESAQILREWQMQLIENEYAASLDEISVRGTRGEEEAKGADLILPTGYHSLLEKMAKGLDVRLEHVVTDVKYGKDGVTVRTSKGELTASAALVTLPLGVLKDSIAAKPSRPESAVRFEPALPKSKTTPIERVGFGSFNKVVLSFPSSGHWPKDKDTFGLASAKFRDFPLFLSLERFSSVTGIAALVSGKAARELEAKSDDKVVSEVMGALRACFGKDLPEPKASLVTRWGKDPFAQGSYSFPAVGMASDDREQLAKPVGKSLHFAGEATDTAFGGAVHGAYLSGIRAADEIDAALDV